MELSFRQYLEKRDGEFQNLAWRMLGIPPKVRQGQVYMGADVQGDDDAENVVPMVVDKVYKKQGKPAGVRAKIMGDLEGNTSTNSYVKDKDGNWVEIGKNKFGNRKRYLPNDTFSKWINQGAEMGVVGGGPIGL